MTFGSSTRILPSLLRVARQRRSALGGLDVGLSVLPRSLDPENHDRGAARIIFALGACGALGLGGSACLCESDAPTGGHRQGGAGDLASSDSALKLPGDGRAREEPGEAVEEHHEDLPGGSTWKSAAVARTFLQTGYGCFQLNIQVSSYNVLCDNGFKRNPLVGSDRAQAYVAPHIQEEFSKCRSDVVCLQEVAPAQYKNVFVPGFAKIGYNGAYITHRIPSFERQGMCIFWKADVFDLISYKPLSWADIGDALGAIGGATIGGLFVLALHHRPSDMAFLVVSAHLSGDVSAEHLKFVQSSLLFRALGSFAISEGIQAIPVIKCEDFSSLPWGSKAWQFDGESSTMTQLDRPESAGVRFHKGSLTVTVPMEEIEKVPAFEVSLGDNPVAAAFVECILFSPPPKRLAYEPT